MISFLVMADRFGVLEEIFWSEPIWLVTDVQTSIFSIFPEEDRDTLKEHFKEALLSDGASCSLYHHPLRELDSSIQCRMVCIQEHVLIFGTDAELNDSSYDRFLVTILKQSIHSQFGDSSTTNHFEQIQMLNNKLMNTHRKLQKANAQLNRLNEELNNRLVKDALTGLTSRYQYRSEMEMVIERTPDGIGMFCFIDLDDFKKINDTYGHAVGDEYLVEFARRLQAIPIDSPTIHIRIAGDEFGLYVHNVDLSESDYCEQFWHIFTNAVLDRPVHTTAGDLPISCCLGTAFYGKDTKNIYNLIDYADFAMYQAKRSGKSTYRIFDQEQYDKEKIRTQ